MIRFTTVFSVAGLAGLAQGCQFNASASGAVKSAGASGEASAEVRAVEGPSDPANDKPAITFRAGQLDYSGVINFEYNRANLQTDDATKKTLSDFKAFLERTPDLKIEIEGHTDSRGTDDYNRDLSDKRAASVRKWLIDNGIAEDRVASVGKGEDSPKVPEPEECNDKVPADISPCEAAWAQNRRVVFSVTAGAESIPVEQPEPAKAVIAVSEPVSQPQRECPWLWGGHANALGPNSWGMLAGATQPGICWLELSLGVGIGGRSIDASAPAPSKIDASYVSFTVPLRGRFWFMNRHSLIGDLGLGFTHYRISGDIADPAGLTGEIKRNTAPMIGHLGLGYGFRPNTFLAGPRFAFTVGALAHLTRLGDSELDVPAGFANGPQLQSELNRETNKLDDLEPYGELSFGWLF
ncbi:MAG: OmpA family protein [Polyangiaceae bacterium]|nr:OmpA family protein [Polyangiaceae bacterium]